MTLNPFKTVATAGALALAALSTQAFACDPVAGALVGGGIGAVVGNGPGAAVGAVIGSTIAAATPCYDDRRYYAPRAAYYEPRYAERAYDDRRYYAPAPAPAYADPAYAQAAPAYADSGYAPAPSYAAPAPSYYAPAPTYYAPAPAYYAPAPYYYNPGPVVVAAALAAPFFVYRGARFVSHGSHFRRWH